MRASRRDFPAGTEGSHTSEDEETCFIEVNVCRDAPPPRTYLLRFTGTLRSADYPSVPNHDQRYEFSSRPKFLVGQRYDVVVDLHRLRQFHPEN